MEEVVGSIPTRSTKSLNVWTSRPSEILESRHSTSGFHQLPAEI